LLIHHVVTLLLLLRCYVGTCRWCHVDHDYVDLTIYVVRYILLTTIWFAFCFVVVT